MFEFLFGKDKEDKNSDGKKKIIKKIKKVKIM